jgi:hypothetical protein
MVVEMVEMMVLHSVGELELMMVAGTVKMMDRGWVE